jgi:hypothetical protein
VGRWLTGIQDADSWKPIEIAWRRLDEGRPGIYADVFFTQAVKFQYPLTVLTLAGGTSRAVLNVVTWLATLSTALLSAGILRAAIRAEQGAPTQGFKAEPALDLLFALAILCAYPLVKAYSLGQIQTVVTALFSALLLAWLTSRRVVAGVALGLMLLIKPTAAPLLLWGVVRRRWRFAGAASATVLAGFAASLPRIPLAEHLAYLDVLSYIGQRGELFYPNQSVNGLLHRWFADGGSLVWNPNAFAAPETGIAVFTTAIGMATLGVALWGVPVGARGSALDLSLMMLAATMAAPVAWEHHYGVLAPTVAASWPAIMVWRPFGRLTGVALAASALVAANYVQAVHRFDGTPLNPLQSYLLFAAVVLWLLMFRTLRMTGEAKART